MTTITIERALLEQALTALTYKGTMGPTRRQRRMAAVDALRAALSAPDDIAAEMSTVADQYAHKLALDLECVLADYSGTWYDTAISTAISTIGAYRGAMNAIHERESPTFMGEPVIRPTLAAPATAPERKPMHEGEIQAAWLGQDLDEPIPYSFVLGIRSAERFNGIKETP